MTGSERMDLALSGGLAGAAGSLLLNVAALWLIPTPARSGRIVSVIARAPAGTLLAHLAYDHSNLAWSFLVLFAVWQGSYAAASAPVLRRRDLAPAPLVQYSTDHIDKPKTR